MNEDPVWRSTAPIVSEITVTFNVDGGSKTVAAQNIQSGSTFTFPSYDGTKDGCIFGGWACGLQVYQPGQSVHLTGDVTVKAIWNAASEDSSDAEGFIDQTVGFLKDNVYIVVLAVVLVVLAVIILHRRVC